MSQHSYWYSKQLVATIISSLTRIDSSTNILFTFDVFMYANDLLICMKLVPIGYLPKHLRLVTPVALAL